MQSKNVIKIVIIIFIISITVAIILTMPKNPENKSNILTSNVVHPVYTGFALPITTFSQVQNIAFTSLNEQRTITISTNDDIVYRTAYISTNGKTWTPITLTGNPYSNSNIWINRTATATINVNPETFNLTSTKTLSTKNYIITYTCTKTNTWDCHSNMWQIRQFNTTLNITQTTQTNTTQQGTQPNTDQAKYYVATNGNDNNPGTITQPFRTIKKAYDLTVPGTTIYVREGTYTDFNGGQWGILRLSRNGTASKPITLKAYPQEKVIIDCQNINDDEHNAVIKITGSYNIIDGFEITRGFKGGIEVYGSNNKIINCNIHHNGNIGVPGSQYGQDGVYSDKAQHDNLYSNNYIHHNGRPVINQLDHGLYLCGDNETVTNNIITYNTAWGLQVAGYSTVSNIKIYNNVLAFNGQGGIVLWLDINNSDIKNNVLYKNDHYGISTVGATGSGNLINYNLFYANTDGTYILLPSGFATLGNNNILDKNPLFVSETNYNLQSTSPAINAGVNVGLLFNGTAPDIGAIESNYVNPTFNLNSCPNDLEVWNWAGDSVGKTVYFGGEDWGSAMYASESQVSASTAYIREPRSHSIHFSVNPTSPTPPAGNINGAYNYRSEIYNSPWHDSSWGVKTEYWLGFSYYFPPEYVHDTSAASDWLQLHVGQEGPPIELAHWVGWYNNSIFLARDWGIYGVGITGEKCNLGFQWQADTWYDIVMHVVWDTESGGAGLTEIWVNGVKLCSMHGGNDFDSDPVEPKAPYAGTPKLGIYKWSWRDNPAGVAASASKGITQIDMYLGPVRYLRRHPGNYINESIGYNCVAPRGQRP